MELTLRPATSADSIALGILASSTFSANFGHLYAPEHLTSHLEKTCSQAFFEQELAQGTKIIIAYDGNTPIGYIKYGKVGLPIDHTSADMELHRLYVIDGYQKAGIGRQLMDAALKDPLMQQAPAIYLGVWENNLRAQTFYASYGFIPVGEYGYHVGPHVDREIIMRRS